MRDGGSGAATVRGRGKDCEGEAVGATGRERAHVGKQDRVDRRPDAESERLGIESE